MTYRSQVGGIREYSNFHQLLADEQPDQIAGKADPVTIIRRDFKEKNCRQFCNNSMKDSLIVFSRKRFKMLHWEF